MASDNSSTGSMPSSDGSIPLNDGVTQTTLPDSELNDSSMPLSDEVTKTTVPDSEPHEKSSTVRYTMECLLNGASPSYASQNEPFDDLVVHGALQGNKDATTVIEVVTTLFLYKSDATEDSKQSQKTHKFLEGKAIHSIDGSRIRILSSHVAGLLRETIDYYPNQNLDGDKIVIREPYGAVFHYWKELTDLHSRLQDSSSPDHDPVKCEHLDVLLQYLRPTFSSSIVPAQRLLDQETPAVAWKDIWYLMRPGSIAYDKNDNCWIGCVIEGAKEIPATVDNPRRWEIEVWLLDFSGDGQRVRPSTKTTEIPFFDGEQKVTSLAVFPREHHDILDGGKRAQKFKDRGALFRDTMWDGYKYANYSGQLLNDTRQVYEGQIVVSVNDSERPPSGVSDDDWFFDPQEEPPDDTKKPATPPRVPQKLWLNVKKDDRSMLSQDHLFICIPQFEGFLLPSQKWASIHLDSVCDLRPESDLPEAILDPQKLSIINALTEHQVNSKQSWSADYIENKGEGVIILLHGPPGVGKTYTVESIAMRKRRPLINLTMSDLGSKEDSVEAALTMWFSYADKWRAVILIDECDIFLERREHKDMSRNGVVSAFLRKMEYFGGLLFLTTNRVGHIDDAFISRIHAIIGFQRFDASRRGIMWDNLLNKLTKERKGSITISNGAKRFLKGPKVLEIDWNGRQIRNALQTAIALAEYEAKNMEDYDPERIIVEVHHFEEVMSLNEEFRRYLNSINARNEAERAKARSWRNDGYDKDSVDKEPDDVLKK
ncbi:uncharacterized protein PG998_000108 [Apiospora kogelbergensis]|uniref:uncharacterized protein n=1 Tax=Apiospora kogelbergensis TaxID=1337665 RepID=UPI00312FCC78